MTRKRAWCKLLNLNLNLKYLSAILYLKNWLYFMPEEYTLSLCQRDSRGIAACYEHSMPEA
jgi:hypothetical protein